MAMLSTDCIKISDLVQKNMAEVLSSKYEIHPFSTDISLDNMVDVMGNYLAMSQAFPYLQAGSQKELIFDCIKNGSGVDVQMEVTSVVGNFLCWDETGGHYVLLKDGMPGLPDILNTGKYFHANLLKKDIHKLFGRDVVPIYSLVTQEYLYSLYQGLSSLSPVIRCASMVAFESHASQMISALWNKISILVDLEQDNLIYFKTHVGGDDPAEAYHVKMTSKMIDKIIMLDQVPFFIEEFDKAYKLSYSWCRNLL
jgi:hypothetical protein